MGSAGICKIISRGICMSDELVHNVRERLLALIHKYNWLKNIWWSNKLTSMLHLGGSWEFGLAVSLGHVGHRSRLALSRSRSLGNSFLRVFSFVFYIMEDDGIRCIRRVVTRWTESYCPLSIETSRLPRNRHKWEFEENFECHCQITFWAMESFECLRSSA